MLQRLLLPIKGNNYHPYILRPLGMGLVVLFILMQPLLYNLSTAHRFQLVDYASDINTSDLLSLTNQQREVAGVADLHDNAQLDQAAEAKATDMFAKDYWAHNSPTGETPWDFITAAGYQYSAAAENLAMDFDTSDGVITGWMNSPEHRTNMLNSIYSDVGFAVMNGTLTGEQTTLVVAEYGAPAASSAPLTAKPSTPAVTHRTTSTPVSTPTPAPVTTAPPAAVVPTVPPATSITAPAATSTDTGGVIKSEDATKPVSLSLVRKVTDIGSLNWGQRVTVFLLVTLLLANLLKHTVVWRKQKRGWRHIWMRAHPAFQSCLLVIALLAVILSSYGVIA